MNLKERSRIYKPKFFFGPETSEQKWDAQPRNIQGETSL